ncbi:hypothetical protein G7Y89_g4108 [Cudoniella acicularis]|uniref:DUF7580 domain-containing protein n=1 Tax=Cudoniella acicularis TaxID=354080 RepID=A0A8H4RQ46_9HELO|nr:hypothetical protein G7Y89_g4108 [Cudoniella acicularis]
MDPATVAGLVLGVVPLLISAVENYEVTFQPFVTYRRYAKEVERFTAKLEAQRAIFHNECQLLLQAIGQNLPDILRDPNHVARKDEQLLKRLQELLGSSYVTCVMTLKLINDTLNEVTEETKGFGDLIEKKKSKGKSTFSLFRQKVKISFSKNRLTDIINELRDYNEDLRRLSSQIRKLSSNSVLPPQPVTSAVISHLQISQQASSRLYEVLASGWACDDKVEHVASMSLKVEEKCKNSASKVRFNLAFTCIQPSLRCKPLWLAIESAPNDEPREPPPEKQAAALQNTLQKMGATGRVRFALSSVITTSTKMGSPSKPQGAGDPQINLCTMGRLCRYFRQVQNQAAPEPCMGFLEKTKTFKHFVYRNPAPQQPTHDFKSVSLKQILHSAAEEKRDRDGTEKLRLARLLALAVLRFHGTNWLPESWGSSDVQFIGDDDAFPDPEKLPDSPCFNTKLSNPSTQPRQIGHTNSSASFLATNETLFNLGVVLIELGYNAPFKKLSQSRGLQVGTNSQVADFIAARRLGESVHKRMNRTYGRLVEKCLNCNFGVATELDNAELQGAVVVQVVNQSIKSSRLSRFTKELLCCVTAGDYAISRPHYRCMILIALGITLNQSAAIDYLGPGQLLSRQLRSLHLLPLTDIAIASVATILLDLSLGLRGRCSFTPFPGSPRSGTATRVRRPVRMSLADSKKPTRHYRKTVAVPKENVNCIYI